MVTLDRLVNVLGSSRMRFGQLGDIRARRCSRSVSSARGRPRPAARSSAMCCWPSRARSVAQAVQWARSSQSVAVLSRTRRRRATSPISRCWWWTPPCRGASWPPIVYGLVLEGRRDRRRPRALGLVALADSVASFRSLRGDHRGRPIRGYSRIRGAGTCRRRQGQHHPEPPRLPAGVHDCSAPGVAFSRIWRHPTTPLFVDAEPARGLTGRTVVAVRAGRELLGSVWATSPNGWTTHAVGHLSDGARTVAMHVLRSRASADPA